MKGLYVHIPFCEHICFYCDFCKRVPKNKEMVVAYLNTLKVEYERVKDMKFDTIYIGGGTPSMLDLDVLTNLLELFKNQNPTEFTIEVNPESYTEEKGLLFKKFGVNRVSLGVQTFNEKILKKLNRHHVNDDVFNTVNHLYKIGIDNVSVDLIFALPNQTIKDIKCDLDMIGRLGIKHISYYSLILEEKTAFHVWYQQDKYMPQDIDVEADMYVFILDELKKMGYIQYEISNFAKSEKYQSKHNILYWTLSPYEAIGAGSHGFNEMDRYTHSTNITSYINDPSITKFSQTSENLYEDFLIFGLRMTKGINLDEVKKRFNRDPLNDFPTLLSYINEGYLDYSKPYLSLTRKGLLVMNQIVEVFL